MRVRVPSGFVVSVKRAVSGNSSVKLPAVLLLWYSGVPPSVAPNRVVPSGTACHATRSGVVVRAKVIDPEVVSVAMSTTAKPMPTFSFSALPPIVFHDIWTSPTAALAGTSKLHRFVPSAIVALFVSNKAVSPATSTKLAIEL